MEVQKFPREAVASLATSRLYAAPGAGNGFNDMHRLAQFLIGEDIFDLQIAQFGEWLAAVARAQYPDMPADDVYEPDAMKAFPAMLSVERPGSPPAAGLVGFIKWMDDRRAAQGLPPAQIAVVQPVLANPQSEK